MQVENLARFEPCYRPYTGQSTPTTAFDGTILILFLYKVDTLNICMKEFSSEKIIFDEMTAVRI